MFDIIGATSLTLFTVASSSFRDASTLQLKSSRITTFFVGDNALMNSPLPSLDDCIHLTTLHIGSHSMQSSGSISFESTSFHLL